MRFPILLCILAATPAAFSQTPTGGHYENVLQHPGGGVIVNCGDIDHDGVDDLLRGFSGGHAGTGFAEVISGADGSVIWSFNGIQVGSAFGETVAAAGDVDGDGTPDLLIGAPDYDGTQSWNGRVVVYSGATGLLIHEIIGNFGAWGIGTEVAGLGDVDGDGLDDFLASGWGLNGQSGALFCYSGADASWLYRLDGTPGVMEYRHDMITVDDLNGDGMRDILLEDEDPGISGSLYALSGMDGQVLWSVHGISVGDAFASYIDIDGDQVVDILSGHGAISILSGATGATLANVPFDSLNYVEHSLHTIGDFNGDGFEDFAGTGGTRTMIFSGADYSVFYREDHGILFPSDRTIARLGDLNGDGRDELVHISLDLGGIVALSFHPILFTDVEEVSASTGTSGNLTFDFPDAAGGYEYLVLLSTWNSRQRHHVHYGVDIPLGDSIHLRNAPNGIYLPFQGHAGLAGTLDANGDGTSTFTTRSGIGPIHIGQTYYLSVVAYPTGGLPEYASIAAEYTIVP